MSDDFNFEQLEEPEPEPAPPGEIERSRQFSVGAKLINNVVLELQMKAHEEFGQALLQVPLIFTGEEGELMNASDFVKYLGHAPTLQEAQAFLADVNRLTARLMHAKYGADIALARSLGKSGTWDQSEL